MGWMENLQDARIFAESASSAVERGRPIDEVTGPALVSIALSLSCIAGDGTGTALDGIKEALDDIDIAIQNAGSGFATRGRPLK